MEANEIRSATINDKQLEMLRGGLEESRRKEAAMAAELQKLRDGIKIQMGAVEVVEMLLAGTFPEPEQQA